MKGTCQEVQFQNIKNIEGLKNAPERKQIKNTYLTEHLYVATPGLLKYQVLQESVTCWKLRALHYSQLF